MKKHPEKDALRLKHMLMAVREIKKFLKGVSLKEFKENRILVLCITKELEIIGEAATYMSDEGRAKYGQVPWKDLIAMRNRLIHGYFNIDEEIVFITATRDLSVVLAALSKVKLD